MIAFGQSQKSKPQQTSFGKEQRQWDALWIRTTALFRSRWTRKFMLTKPDWLHTPIMFLLQCKGIFVTAVRGGSENHMQRICSQLITVEAATRKQCLPDWKSASLPTSRSIWTNTMWFILIFNGASSPRVAWKMLFLIFRRKPFRSWKHTIPIYWRKKQLPYQMHCRKSIRQWEKSSSSLLTNGMSWFATRLPMRRCRKITSVFFEVCSKERSRRSIFSWLIWQAFFLSGKKKRSRRWITLMSLPCFRHTGLHLMSVLRRMK